MKIGGAGNDSFHSNGSCRVEVERNDSAFSFRMFHCRSRDMGDDKHVPLADWAYDEISMLNIRSGTFLVSKSSRLVRVPVIGFICE